MLKDVIYVPDHDINVIYVPDHDLEEFMVRLDKYIIPLNERIKDKTVQSEIAIGDWKVRDKLKHFLLHAEQVKQEVELWKSKRKANETRHAYEQTNVAASDADRLGRFFDLFDPQKIGLGIL